MPSASALVAPAPRPARDAVASARAGDRQPLADELLHLNRDIHEPEDDAVLDALPHAIGRTARPCERAHSVTPGSTSVAVTTVIARCAALFAATVSPGFTTPSTRQLRTVPVTPLRISSSIRTSTDPER
jgi:hypothetical protein